MPSILFVCTGNIFRSMTAEYALKAMLNPHSPIRMSSAGTVALPQAMRPDVHAYILRRGIDPSQHQQRKVSAELLHASDCVIAMSRDHQAFLFDTFQYQAPLFNEVSHGRVVSLNCLDGCPRLVETSGRIPAACPERQPGPDRTGVLGSSRHEL
jgi:protein-tyrosine phosphatase